MNVLTSMVMKEKVFEAAGSKGLPRKNSSDRHVITALTPISAVALSSLQLFAEDRLEMKRLHDPLPTSSI